MCVWGIGVGMHVLVVCVLCGGYCHYAYMDMWVVGVVMGVYGLVNWSGVCMGGGRICVDTHECAYMRGLTVCVVCGVCCVHSTQHIWVCGLEGW